MFGTSFENGVRTYLGQFEIHAQPGTQGITYSNMTTAAAEFSTQAGVRCLAPAKSATLPASGHVTGTVRLKTDCASSKVYMQRAFDATIPSGQGVRVEFGLQLM